MSNELRRLECLRRLELELHGSNRSLRDFEGMPNLGDEQLEEVLAQFEHDIDANEHYNRVNQLNGEQRAAFDRFVAALEHHQPLILNLDAPGGTGQFSLSHIFAEGLHVQVKRSYSIQCWNTRCSKAIARSPPHRQE